MRITKVSAEKGAALVEFAVVFPILLLLLMGIVEFGLLFYNKQVLTNASREGARAGIAYDPLIKRYPTGEEIGSIVVDYCRRTVQVDDTSSRLIRFDTDADPDITVTGAQGSYGQDLTVTVSYDYTFMVPDLLGFGPNMQLTAQTVMKMERAAGP